MEIADFDIVIVGAGSAGVAAAVAASELGSRVLVLEKYAYGGGKATAAEVGTLCGLFHQSDEAQPKWLVNGYARQFADQLVRGKEGRTISAQDGLHFIRYEIADFRELVDEEFSRNKVEVWYQSEVYAVEFYQHKIQSVSIRKNGESFSISCLSIIDCSGDAVIAKLAGLDLIKSEKYQAASRVFTLRRLNSTNEQTLSMTLWRSILRGIKEGLLDDYFSNVFVVQGSFEKGMASFKFTIPIEVTHEKSNMEELNQCSHDMILRLVSFLKGQQEFHDIELVAIANEVGVRTGPRPMGHVVLTGEDVCNSRKWSDAIARSAWPMEFWSTNQKVQMHYLKSGDYYEVPASCLTTPSVQNLFFAGRMISADERAIASARVMGVCLQTGYAAGALAAFYLNNRSQDSAIRFIQSKQILS